MAKEETRKISPETDEITVKDMPLTPSLEPKVDSGLRMPTLNRLTSTDWPLTNRIRESSNGKVNIVRTEDAGKSPTPKARSYSRVTSFRSLQASEDLLGSMAQPLLFRTVSEISDLGVPHSRVSNDGVSNDGIFDQSQDDKVIPTIPVLPPPLNFVLPTVASPTHLKTKSNGQVIFHRDGRRARFAKTLSPVHRRRRRLDVNDDTSSSSTNKRSFSSSSVTTTVVQREKKRSRSNSDVSNASNNSNGLGCSCKRSRCRKKYCLCFANGTACTPDCRCEDCGNTPEDGLFSGLYTTRYCRCDNSRCRKKYCVCFQDGKFCSPCCKCKNCENQPGDHNNFASMPTRKKKKTKKASFKRKDPRRSGAIRLSGVSVVVV